MWLYKKSTTGGREGARARWIGAQGVGGGVSAATEATIWSWLLQRQQTGGLSGYGD